MSNKFLEKYPNLWIPKVGDKVEIIKVLNNIKKPTDNWYYKIKDTGEIIHIMTLTRYTLYQVKFHKNHSVQSVFVEEIIPCQ